MLAMGTPAEKKKKTRLAALETGNEDTML